jgi:hypothetical protein
LRKSRWAQQLLHSPNLASGQSFAAAVRASYYFFGGRGTKLLVRRLYSS